MLFGFFFTVVNCVNLIVKRIVQISNDVQTNRNCYSEIVSSSQHVKILRKSTKVQAGTKTYSSEGIRIDDELEKTYP